MTGRRLAIVSLLLLPLLWLWPCVFGGRTFVPYDLAQFPPVSLIATPEQLAQAKGGANFDVTEVPPWFLPELVLARDELRAGRLPVWDPFARTGAPLHAHGLIGLCYPVTWLALLAGDPAGALVWIAWIDLALGGLLAFGLLRALGLPLLPAWFGALLFELCAPMATNAFFWMRLASFVWLPGVLWAVLVVARAERLQVRQLGALAGAFAMTWLGGFPPFAATTTVLGGAFAAWLVVARWREGGAAAARAPALRLLAGFLLGAMLAMPQVLPSLQFFPHSARPTTPAWVDIERSAFESYGLLGYLMPDAAGHPGAQGETPYGARNVLGLLLTTRLENGAPTQPNFNYTEYAVFVGQLGLLLALAGAIAGRGQHRVFAISAWLLCAGLALFVPVVRLLFHLPVVNNVWPMRWLAPATIFVAWLGALGLERLLAAARRLPLVLAATAAALALVLAVAAARPAAWHAADPSWVVQRLAAKHRCSEQAVVDHMQGVPPVSFDFYAAAFARLAAEGQRGSWWLAGAAAWFALLALLRGERQRRWLGIAAGALAALQLGLHGATFTRGSAGATSVETPVHAFLRERAAAGASTGGFTIARASIAPDLPRQLPPGELMVRGMRDLHFYSHADARSLQPLRTLLGGDGERIAGKGYLTEALPPAVYAHPLLDLLGVRYVLACPSKPEDANVLAAIGPRVGPTLPGFVVHERTSALPRAFAVPRVEACASDDAVVRAMLAPDWVPHTVAYALGSELPQPAPAAAGAPPRQVQFVRDDPAWIELDVGAGAFPWLLLTDTLLPGWTATVDGEPVAIVRADHAFRLVALPERACRVRFTYRAPGLLAGTLLAILATLALALCAFATHRRTAPAS